MKRIVSTVLAVLALSISSAEAAPAVSAHTLAGNPRLPASLLQDFFKPEQWDAIQNVKYDGYVILRGSIDHKRKVRVRKAIESYPDNSRDAFAIECCQDIKLAPLGAGGRIVPTAEVYVIFYETGRTPREAIVIAKSLGSAANVTTTQGAEYMVLQRY